VTHRQDGLAMAAIAATGLVIAVYLTAIRMAGELPACGPIRGCEEVALSPYSTLAGIPVAALGAVYSALLVLLGVARWRTGDRRPVLAAYGLGLAGVVTVAYLTWLEVAVIGAVCVWCVGYAITVVGGWLVAILAARRSA
jgi:uncharacterized membrane protein